MVENKENILLFNKIERLRYNIQRDSEELKVLIKDYGYDENNYVKDIIKDCIILCNHYFGTDLITKDLLMSKTRKREIVFCRQICIFIITKRYNMSLVSTGKIFKRDHSTCINSVKRINDILTMKHDHKEKRFLEMVLRNYNFTVL